MTGEAWTAEVVEESLSEEEWDRTDASPDELGDMMVLSPSGREIKATMKWPLNARYCIWYNCLKDMKPKSRLQASDWSANNTLVGTISTIQDFWRYWNNIDLMSVQGIFSVFREGVKPTWEDDANSQGGRWIMNTVKFDQRANMYTDVVLAMIGGHFDAVCAEDNDQIQGVLMANPKAKFKMELWNRRANEENMNKVDYRLREILLPNSSEQDNYNFQISYKDHAGRIQSDMVRNETSTSLCPTPTMTPNLSSMDLDGAFGGSGD